MNSVTLSWRDVLDCKKWHGHINNIAWAAVEAGYKFFLWNERVYQILDSCGEDIKDTGMTIKDIS